MEEEIWVPINTWECCYEISSLGRLKSLARQKGVHRDGSPAFYKEKIFNRRPKHQDYYIRVCLCKDERKEYHQLHLIVAHHFIPNPENKKTANHKDGNKQNNKVSNLEWNTYKENNRHAKDTGLNKTIGETHHWATLNSKEVLQIFKASGTNKEIAKKYGVSPTNVSHIKTGKTWWHTTGKQHVHSETTRLTEDQVLEILKMDKNNTEIGKLFKISGANVGYIKSGLTHKTVYLKYKNEL